MTATCDPTWCWCTAKKMSALLNSFGSDRTRNSRSDGRSSGMDDPDVRTSPMSKNPVNVNSAMENCMRPTIRMLFYLFVFSTLTACPPPGPPSRRATSLTMARDYGPLMPRIPGSTPRATPGPPWASSANSLTNITSCFITLLFSSVSSGISPVCLKRVRGYDRVFRRTFYGNGS